MRTRASGLLVLLALTACTPGSAPPPDAAGPVRVAVVGDGVPPADPSLPRVYPLNRAQGEAMWNGVDAAFSGSPRLAPLRSQFTLLPRDDGGDENRAATIAREVRENPAVIAVIGHATSATTRAAAHIYAEAGIPLLMPIATGPKVMYPPDSDLADHDRLTNCFRLPPSDDKSQAPAVAYLAIEQLHASKIFLLGDKSEGALEYSSTLYAWLQKKLARHIVGQTYVDRFKENFEALGTNIQAQKTELVIFCGYGTTATALLNGLRRAYDRTPGSPRPELLLTDGCRIDDLDTTGFTVHVTFPDIAVVQEQSLVSEIDAARSILSEGAYPSYAILGYDAALILAEAVRLCEHEGVTRSCVRRHLASGRSFLGIAGTYTFMLGENVAADYCLLRAVWDEPSNQTQYTVEMTIGAQIIRRVEIGG